MDFEFETTRTGLLNDFVAAGAKLLGYQPLVSTAVAMIPGASPQKYAIAGTLPGILQMAGKMMGEDGDSAVGDAAQLVAEARAVFDLMLEGCSLQCFGDYQNGLGEEIGPRMDALHEKLRAFGSFSASPAAAEKPTGDLTDEQIQEIAHEISSGRTDLGSYLFRPNLLLDFARAIARAAIAAHLERQAQAAPAAPDQVRVIPGLQVEEISQNFYHVSCGGVWSTAYEHTGDLGNKLLAKIAQAYLAAPASQEGAHAALEEVQVEEWSYSTDEERYHDPEPSRLAILKHALAEVEAADDGASQFWIGRNVRFTGKGDAGVIIDGLKEQAYDECGEFAETYLEDVTPAEEAELESLVTDWARRVDRSNFWTVTNTECFTIESAKAEIERLDRASAERSGDHE